ncbi:FAD-binding protein [Hyphomicrobium sp.]|uniref:FAD-binding protein n=1 Tax=Hyphomicrobium sp. TaxID=82 RepID=UPI002FE19ACB
MDRSISRRDFGGLLTGAASTAILSAVLPAPAVWAQGRSSSASDLASNLQGIAGEVIVDEASRAAYADDYGRIVHKIPDAVLVPRDSGDLVKLVQYANKSKTKIGIRGMGHSMLGQAQIDRGVLVDMAALDSISILDNDRVEVGAGSTWGPVMSETAANKRTLPVINDTFLSVGGSLSTAGFGPTTWNKGLMVDNTLELEVVTGAGELVRCSETTNQDLFLAVLSGLGQCAIITRAVMKQVAAPTHVLYIKIFYDDDAIRAAHDLAFLARDGRFNHLDLRSRTYPFGGLEYYIEGGVFYDAPNEPKLDDLKKGLSASSFEPKTWTYEEYYRRAESCYSCVPAPKPSLYLTVPASKFDVFVKNTLSDPSTSAYIAPWFSIWRRDAQSRPLARVADEDFIYRTQFNRVLPNSADVKAFLALNRALYEKVRDLGGTRLTTSAIPFEPKDWERHYGAAWPAFKATKEKYDPGNVLGSSVNVFGKG